MKEIAGQLRQLGFAEYEAKAYVALLQRSPLNGYELAKLSGVPRADIYSILQKLENRGAVLRLDTGSGARYAAVPPADLMRRVRSEFLGTLESARESLEEISAPPEYEYVLNARGYSPLLAHAADLIDGAQHQLWIAISRRDVEDFGDGLVRAEARGVAINTLCVQACAVECGHCRGSIHRHRVEPEASTRSVVIVRDQEELLVGEIGEGEEALVVRTRQPLLVQLATWHLRNSVALATLASDVGDRLPPMISPQASRALASLGGGEGDRDWLSYMRGLMGSRGPVETAEEEHA